MEKHFFHALSYLHEKSVTNQRDSWYHFQSRSWKSPQVHWSHIPYIQYSIEHSVRTSGGILHILFDWAKNWKINIERWRWIYLSPESRFIRIKRSRLVMLCEPSLYFIGRGWSPGKNLYNRIEWIAELRPWKVKLISDTDPVHCVERRRMVVHSVMW